MKPEEMAQRFHEAYERLAPSFGYETRRESAVPWAEVPESNRRLMAATVAEAVGPLLAEVERLRGVVADVSALHQSVKFGPPVGEVCQACWTDVWPCETRAALEGREK